VQNATEFAKYVLATSFTFVIARLMFLPTETIGRNTTFYLKTCNQNK
jgi:hypothetical protein